jgi:hypothetical protein
MPMRKATKSINIQKSSANNVQDDGLLEDTHETS